MASESASAPRGGISFAGLLAILFIGLKLGGVGSVATWSWLWVLSPIWIPLVIIAVIFAIALVIYLIR